MGLKIVIADCSWRSMDVEKRYLPHGAEVLMYQIADEEGLSAACHDADAILAEYAPFTAKVLRGSPAIFTSSVILYLRLSS